MSAAVDVRVLDLNKAYDEFHMDRAKRLGKGGFGKVYLIRSRRDDSQWAAKYQKQSNERLRGLIREEAGRLRHLQNSEQKYVMGMYGYYEKRDHTLLVTEYLSGGELFDKITERGFSLTESKVITYVRQIVKALNYVHRNRIVHLDIKPQNIMLQRRDSDRIKLIDFGLAKTLLRGGRVKVGFAGTIGFMAPEMLNCAYATPATDFFSLGVVVFMLLSGGHEPFWMKDDMTTMKRTLKRRQTYEHIKPGVSKSAFDFIDGLLVKSAELRLHGEPCLSHQWLSSDELDGGFSIVLETNRIRRYQARQRWAKAIKAVRAMVRMQAILADRNSESSPFPAELIIPIRINRH